jgi:hypothetical protein
MAWRRRRRFCGSMAMLLQSCWLRVDPPWRFRSHVLLGLAGLCFAAIWVDAFWHGMPRGLEQQLVIVLMLAWLMLAVGCLIRCLRAAAAGRHP